MLLYAHRGANRRAPENTLTAFRLAIAEGADGVELDVRTCKSGEVVVAHDPHLGGVGDRAAWVAMLSWESLRSVRIGEDERVPLLDEAIDLVVGAGLGLNIEVKGDAPDRPALARAVASPLLARRPQRERDAIVLSSFSPTVIQVLRSSNLSVPIAFLFDREHTGLLRGALAGAAAFADRRPSPRSDALHTGTARALEKARFRQRLDGERPRSRTRAGRARRRRTHHR